MFISNFIFGFLLEDSFISLMYKCLEWPKFTLNESAMHEVGPKNKKCKTEPGEYDQEMKQSHIHVTQQS